MWEYEKNSSNGPERALPIFGVLTVDLIDAKGAVDDKAVQLYKRIWHIYDISERLESLGASGDMLDFSPDEKREQQELTALLEVGHPPGVGKRPGKKRSLAPSEIFASFGMIRVLGPALALRDQLGAHQGCQNKAYFLDVQAALRTELNTAYDFLASEQRKHLWHLCDPELVQLVRARDTKPFVARLNQFVGMAYADWPITVTLTQDEINHVMKVVPSSVADQVKPVLGKTLSLGTFACQLACLVRDEKQQQEIMRAVFERKLNEDLPIERSRICLPG